MTVIPIQTRPTIDNCHASSKTKDQKFDKVALKWKKFARERDSARSKTRNYEFNKSTVEPLEISSKTRLRYVRKLETSVLVREELYGVHLPEKCFRVRKQLVLARIHQFPALVNKQANRRYYTPGRRRPDESMCVTLVHQLAIRLDIEYALKRASPHRAFNVQRLKTRAELRPINNFPVLFRCSAGAGPLLMANLSFTNHYTIFWLFSI